MKKILVLIFLLVTLSLASDLYIVGDDNERKGCITCNEYSGESIWNEYSTYGNEYNTESIWNEYGIYGNEYNSSSPWNEYGKGMKIVDIEGNYYGYFTTNKYNDQTEVPLLKAILDAYSSKNWDSLKKFRNWAIENIF